MGDNGRVSRLAGRFDRFQRLAERTDLVHLDKDRVANVGMNTPTETLLIGNEQIVSHQLHPVTQPGRQARPPVPIVLAQSIFNGNNGISPGPVLPEINHLLGGPFRPVGFVKHILTVVVELR